MTKQIQTNIKFVLWKQMSVPTIISLVFSLVEKCSKYWIKIMDETIFHHEKRRLFHL